MLQFMFYMSERSCNYFIYALSLHISEQGKFTAYFFLSAQYFYRLVNLNIEHKKYHINVIIIVFTFDFYICKATSSYLT